MSSDGWSYLPLADVCERVSVGHVGLTSAHFCAAHEGVPLVRSQNVRPGRLDLNDIRYVTPEFHAATRKSHLCPGDILFVRVGQNRGDCCVVPSGLTSLNCANIVFARPREALSSFLGYYFQSSKGQQALLSVSTGSAQGVLNTHSIASLRVPVPPDEVARDIAATLGCLDDKINLNCRMNGVLTSLAGAIFRSWFIDVDQPYDKGVGEDRMSSEWPSVPFADTVEILSGGTPRTTEPEYWNGEIPWYSVADSPPPGDVFVVQTEKRITSNGVENSAAQVVPPLTTIISARGTVGKCALTGKPMAFNQSCFGLRPRAGNGLCYTYFSTVRVVDQLCQSAHGSVFNTITRTTFAAVTVPLPPADLVSEFEGLIQPLMARILLNVRESETLRQTRDALMPRLLSGELLHHQTDDNGVTDQAEGQASS